MRQKLLHLFRNNLEVLEVMLFCTENNCIFVYGLDVNEFSKRSTS